MAEKLKIVSLGGLDEIGKNMTVFEYAGDLLVVDCGIGFPDDEMYGVDTVIPDMTYLKQNEKNIVGVVITHGHEDHLGALPYLLDQISAPVYTAQFTAALAELKLQEHKPANKAEIHVVKAGDTVRLGAFKVEFIRINHSIPDALALAITTGAGTVIHTGDIKIDTTPISGEMIDLTRFGVLGQRGVLAMLCDSTNAEKPGYSLSERKVAEAMDGFFKDYPGRIIVTTFASNVHRIQQVLDASAKYGRKVCVTGRSMENVIRIASELGYLKVPEGLILDVSLLKKLPKNQVTVITTGSQGENMSALYRIAFGSHKQVEVMQGDRVIISASAIPGNEKEIGKVINELFRLGAEVIYDRSYGLHASGHACQEELKLLMALIKPKYFIPVHGEHRQLCINASLAETMGVPRKHIVIPEMGRKIELDGRSIKKTDLVQAGPVLVDGTGVGDVGSVVLRDRQHLAADGMLVVMVGISAEDGSLVFGPEIITRGFVYVKESEKLLDDLREVTLDAIYDVPPRSQRDPQAMKGRIKGMLSDYLFKKVRRNPMILPVVTVI